MYDGSDNDKPNAQADAPGAEEQTGLLPAESSGQTRRRFSRNALAGSGVLLTLGNSSAWGQFAQEGGTGGAGDTQGGTPVCVSTMILESFAITSNVNTINDPDLNAYLDKLDMMGNPPPGYKVIQDGTDTCIVPDN